MRLIDADLLSEAIYDNVSAPYEEAVWAKEDCLTEIDAAPTVDAVEVVRCRECKWWQEDDDIGHCDNPDGLDNYAKPEDFCSYGEKRRGKDGTT